MSYKKNIRFKVKAETGKLIRKFNVKIVIELNQQDIDSWLSDQGEPDKEFVTFCLLISYILKEKESFFQIPNVKSNLHPIFLGFSLVSSILITFFGCPA